jgi:hypothetical protein
MPVEDVLKVRDGLKAKFSRDNFVEAVAAALHDAGTVRTPGRIQ